MNRVSFKDPEKNEQLIQLGYATFELFDSETIEAVAHLIEKYQLEHQGHFFSSTHLKNTEQRKQISDEILSLTQANIEAHFQNIFLAGAALLIKPQGKPGTLPIHQDWNLVDEKQARSYNLWVPLQDVDDSNGAMKVLEGSHDKMQTYRGPNIQSIFKEIETKIVQHFKTVELKKGTAILYDHALWHSSPPNLSTKNRNAIVYGVTPKDEDLLIYVGEKNQIKSYHSYPDFFMERDLQTGHLTLEERERNIPPNDLIDLNQFNSLYFEKQGNSFFKRIKRFFQ